MRHDRHLPEGEYDMFGGSRKPRVLILAWLPEGALARLEATFPQLEFVEGTEANRVKELLSTATVTYGAPPVADNLATTSQLRWIQLISAGVPRELCLAAAGQDIIVTNLAGLYGPTIAEHALGLMLILARNLHTVLRNQQQSRWDRDVAQRMSDLQGRTLAVIGLGNIGCSIARLARCFGMRVVGCRRTDRWTPAVDQLYPVADLHQMLGEADYVAVSAPLTDRTEGMLGPDEFRAMKQGAVYINVSRGSIAQEQSLLDALESGRLAAAGLDVYATEPLRADHPFWAMPQVVISPHYSGETVNRSSLPVERFTRNLQSFLVGRPLEGVVDLVQGY